MLTIVCNFSNGLYFVYLFAVTSPIQGASGSVPDCVDATEGTLAELRQDPNIPSNLLNSAFSHTAKTITGLFTLTKPDGKDSNHEADPKSETTAVEVGHMTLPSPDPKTYSQKHFEKFKEKL